MDKMEQQKSGLSEATFNTLPCEFDWMSIQVEYTRSQKVCTRVAGKLEVHGPDENSLKGLCTVVIHDRSISNKQTE